MMRIDKDALIVLATTATTILVTLLVSYYLIALPKQVDEISLGNGSYVTKVGAYVPLKLLVPNRPIEVQAMVCTSKGGVLYKNTYCLITWE